MHHSTILRSLPRLLVLALLSVALAAGCGRSDPGEFHSYSELDRADRPPTGDADQPVGANDHDPDSPAAPAAPSRTGNQGDQQRAADESVAAATAPAPSPAPSGNGSAEPSPSDPLPTADPLRPSTADPGAAPRELASAPIGVPEPGAGLPDAPDRLVAADPPVEAPRPEPREIKLLVPHRSFRVEGPDAAIRVSYDDIDLLRVLNMEPVPADCLDYFPDWLRELDGQRIRIRGFMYPPYQMTGIRHFVLARDNEICCMGRDPKRYDVIDVVVRKEAAASYIANRPFDVVGVFRIQPEDDDGELYQLYVIEDAFIIDR